MKVYADEGQDVLKLKTASLGRCGQEVTIRYRPDGSKHRVWPCHLDHRTARRHALGWSGRDA